jgi:hypothetical protein
MNIKGRYLKELRTFIGKMDLEVERVTGKFDRIYYLPKGRERIYIGYSYNYNYLYSIPCYPGSSRYCFDLLLKIGLQDKIDHL